MATTPQALALALGLTASLGACKRNNDTPPVTEPTETVTQTAEGSADDSVAPVDGSGEPGIAAEGCPDAPDDAVALVGCEPVMTASELDAEIAAMVERYEQLPGRSPTTVDWRNERRQRLVRNAIQEAVLAQHVEERGIVVSDADVAQHIRDEIGHVFDNEDLFARFLHAHGTTREAYLEMVRAEIALDRVLAERGQLEPTDEDIQHFYLQNSERWREGERVLVSAITVRLRSNASDEDVAAAETRANALRDRVTDGGEDFATVAGEASEGPERQSQGDLGWIVRGRSSRLSGEDVEELLFSATPGTVTEPVRTSIGWQFFLVHDHRQEGIRELDEVRETLIEPIRRRNRGQLSRELENELSAESAVVLNEAAWGLEEDE